MRLIQNIDSDRLIDLMRSHLKAGHDLACVTPSLSLFAFANCAMLVKLERVQLILPPADDTLEFLGSEGGRAARNRILRHWS